MNYIYATTISIESCIMGRKSTNRNPDRYGLSSKGIQETRRFKSKQQTSPNLTPQQIVSFLSEASRRSHTQRQSYPLSESIKYSALQPTIVHPYRPQPTLNLSQPESSTLYRQELPTVSSLSREEFLMHHPNRQELPTVSLSHQESSLHHPNQQVLPTVSLSRQESSVNHPNQQELPTMSLSRQESSVHHPNRFPKVVPVDSFDPIDKKRIRRVHKIFWKISKLSSDLRRKGEYVRGIPNLRILHDFYIQEINRLNFPNTDKNVNKNDEDGENIDLIELIDLCRSDEDDDE